MSSTIKQAIEKRRKIRMVCERGICVAEPYAFGIDCNGKPILLCFKTDTFDTQTMQDGWRVVRLADLIGITPLNESFRRIRSGYIRNHPAFQTVLIQI